MGAAGRRFLHRPAEQLSGVGRGRGRQGGVELNGGQPEEARAHEEGKDGGVLSCKIRILTFRALHGPPQLCSYSIVGLPGLYNGSGEKHSLTPRGLQRLPQAAMLLLWFLWVPPGFRLGLQVVFKWNSSKRCMPVWNWSLQNWNVENSICHNFQSQLQNDGLCTAAWNSFPTTNKSHPFIIVFLPMNVSGNLTQQTPISRLFHLRKSGIWLPCMSFSVFNSSQPVNWKMWVEASWRLKMLCRFKVTWALLKNSCFGGSQQDPKEHLVEKTTGMKKTVQQWISSKFIFHRSQMFTENRNALGYAFSGKDS